MSESFNGMRGRRQSLAVAASAIRRKSLAVIKHFLEKKKDEVKLKKVLSVFDATAYIICTVIGAGIFISPKNVLLFAGSPGAALVMWLVTGLVTAVDGLCTAELALTVPKAGASYTYVKEGLGDAMSFLVVWIQFIASVFGSRGLLAVTFAANMSKVSLKQTNFTKIKSLLDLLSRLQPALRPRPPVGHLRHLGPDHRPVLRDPLGSPADGLPHRGETRRAVGHHLRRDHLRHRLDRVDRVR